MLIANTKSCKQYFDLSVNIIKKINENDTMGADKWDHG
jgi:hypothetical protein